MNEPRFPVPHDASHAFTAVAQGTRLSWHMFNSCGSPASGSNFARVDSLYPFEKVSDRARHYVSAALEHLIMWADFAAPFKYHPEQTTTFTLRPPMALARAALESASQAVWLLNTPDVRECLQRHLRLIRWDLEEYRKSHLEAEGKKRVKERDEELLARVAGVFTQDQIRPPQGYLWVIQQACEPEDLDLSASQAERLWRAMSGAAHGMYWTNLELMTTELSEHHGAGQAQRITLPDPAAMVESLEAAHRIAQYAALKYMIFAGADIRALQLSARRWLAHQITLKPDADPEVFQRLAGEVVGHADR